MNKYLQFLVEHAETKEKDYLAMRDGLIQLDSIFQDSLIISPELDYEEAYDRAINEMDDLYNTLSPTGLNIENMYGPRGADFTVTFWLYMTTLILEQNPSEYYSWEDFGETMNKYLFDMDPFILTMYGNKKEEDQFPLARLLDNVGMLGSIISQEYFSYFFACEAFLEYVAKVMNDPQNFSFKQIMNRMQDLSSMRIETWVRLASSMKILEKHMLIRGTTFPNSIRSQMDRSLLTQNSKENDMLVGNILNSTVSMLKNDEDYDHDAKSVTNGVVMHFIKKYDADLAKVINGFLDPSKISLPLGQDAMNLLLLTNLTLSESKPYYYEAYSVAYDIYDGRLEDDRDDYYNFIKKVHKSLIPYFMAGYTNALEEYNLKLLL